jgi:hypothetical protein
VFLCAPKRGTQVLAQFAPQSFGVVPQGVAPSELQRISARESAEITAGKLPAKGCSSGFAFVAAAF